jgi:diguanylate cyclase (GGDEF)-like protein
LKLVLDNAIKVTGTEAGSIALLDESSNEIAIKTAKGFSEDFMHTHRWKIRPEGMTAKILSRTEPFILSNALKEPTFNNPIALREGIRSLIAVPLYFNDKIIGILYVDDFEVRTFSESEVRLVSILATQAAIAINNAQMHEKAKWLAITDGLTEVYNHRFFQEQLSKEIKRAERYNHSISIIMMDLDYFKEYNDFFGHKKGDEVLKIIARLLTECTRKSDLVPRYGGDEFVVILPETQKEKALELAERIRAKIEGSVLVKAEEFENGNLTISLGVASYPDDAKTAGELIDKVDEVLYLAKRTGKNKACSLDRKGQGLYCIPRGLKKPG